MDAVYQVYKHLRDEKGVSDADVIRAVGANTSILSDWKKGRAQPKIDKLVKISRYFGVDVNVFIDAMDIQ